MAMITGTRSESVSTGCYWSINSCFRLELRYIGLDYLYLLFVIDTIISVTKYSNIPSYQQEVNCVKKLLKD